MTFCRAASARARPSPPTSSSPRSCPSHRLEIRLPPQSRTPRRTAAPHAPEIRLRPETRTSLLTQNRRRLTSPGHRISSRPEIAVFSPHPKTEFRPPPKSPLVSPRPKSEIRPQHKIAGGPTPEFRRRPKIAVFSRGGNNGAGKKGNARRRRKEKGGGAGGSPPLLSDRVHPIAHLIANLVVPSAPRDNLLLPLRMHRLSPHRGSSEADFTLPPVARRARHGARGAER